MKNKKLINALVISSCLCASTAYGMGLDAGGKRFANPNYHRQQAQPAATKECNICLESKRPREFTTLECGHASCTACLENIVRNMIVDKNSRALKCPNIDCKTPMALQDITTISRNNRDTIDTFANIKNKEYLATLPGMRHCPTPDCPESFTNEENRAQNMVCQSCMTQYCANCLLPHSHGMTCKEAQEVEQLKPIQNSKDKAERATRELLEKNTKKCPRCSVNIEKNEGCQHMTCRQCRYDFCWNCLGDYDVNGRTHRCAPTPAPTQVPVAQPVPARMTQTTQTTTVELNGDNAFVNAVGSLFGAAMRLTSDSIHGNTQTNGISVNGYNIAFTRSTQQATRNFFAVAREFMRQEPDNVSERIEITTPNRHFSLRNFYLWLTEQERATFSERLQVLSRRSQGDTGADLRALFDLVVEFHRNSELAQTQAQRAGEIYTDANYPRRVNQLTREEHSELMTQNAQYTRENPTATRVQEARNAIENLTAIEEQAVLERSFANLRPQAQPTAAQPGDSFRQRLQEVDEIYLQANFHQRLDRLTKEQSDAYWRRSSQRHTEDPRLTDVAYARDNIRILTEIEQESQLARRFADFRAQQENERRIEQERARLQLQQQESEQQRDIQRRAAEVRQRTKEREDADRLVALRMQEQEQQQQELARVQRADRERQRLITQQEQQRAEQQHANRIAAEREAERQRLAEQQRRADEAERAAQARHRAAQQQNSTPVASIAPRVKFTITGPHTYGVGSSYCTQAIRLLIMNELEKNGFNKAQLELATRALDTFNAEAHLKDVATARTALAKLGKTLDVNLNVTLAIQIN